MYEARTHTMMSWNERQGTAGKATMTYRTECMYEGEDKSAIDVDSGVVENEEWNEK